MSIIFIIISCSAIILSAIIGYMYGYYKGSGEADIKYDEMIPCELCKYYPPMTANKNRPCYNCPAEREES